MAYAITLCVCDRVCGHAPTCAIFDDFINKRKMHIYQNCYLILYKLPIKVCIFSSCKCIFKLGGIVHIMTLLQECIFKNIVS
jgi:hypothetical protein